MAVVVGGATLTVYELALAAAAAIGALFFVSPQGQKATREAAQATADALKKARKRPDEDPEPKPPKPIVCPCGSGNKDDKEPCPVCGKGVNPVKGFRPAYLDPPPRGRVPTDAEVNPPLTVFNRTSMIVKGARVFQRPDGSYIHRDTLHTGKGAELETYNKRGRHIGTVCPNCGAPIDGPDDNKTINP